MGPSSWISVGVGMNRISIDADGAEVTQTALPSIGILPLCTRFDQIGVGLGAYYTHNGEGESCAEIGGKEMCQDTDAISQLQVGARIQYTF